MFKKGIALVVAIAMLLMASLMQVAYIALYYNNYRMAQKLLRNVKSHYYAYAAQNAILDYILDQGGEIDQDCDASGTLLFQDKTISYTAWIDNLVWTDTNPNSFYIDSEGHKIYPYHIWCQAGSGGAGDINVSSRINLWINYDATDSKFKEIFWQMVKPQ